MTDVKHVYWDTSCFICFLNETPEEIERQDRCEAVLREAERGEVRIWTSCLTIAEVVRPKEPFSVPALPNWAQELLSIAPAQHRNVCDRFRVELERICV